MSNLLNGVGTADADSPPMTDNTASSTRLLCGLESTIVRSVYSLPRGAITAAPSPTLSLWQPCFIPSGPKLVLVWGLL